MGFTLGIGAELGVKRFWHSQKKSASPYSWARPSEKARQRALNVEPRALYVARQNVPFGSLADVTRHVVFGQLSPIPDIPSGLLAFSPAARSRHGSLYRQ
jgi:hypothetical protein